MTSARREPKSRRPPATTPELRENQLIDKAVTLVEQQIESGKVSSQVLVHYLRLASSRERLEQDKLRGENALLKARVESLSSMARVEELYSNALRAMRAYSGQSEEEDGREDQVL